MKFSIEELNAYIACSPKIDCSECAIKNKCDKFQGSAALSDEMALYCIELKKQIEDLKGR